MAKADGGRTVTSEVGIGVVLGTVMTAIMVLRAGIAAEVRIPLRRRGSITQGILSPPPGPWWSIGSVSCLELHDVPDGSLIRYRPFALGSLRGVGEHPHRFPRPSPTSTSPSHPRETPR